MTVKITHVGQELWYQPNYGGVGRSIKVKAIGRKWVAFDGLLNRLEIATGIIDGKNYGSPGTLYNNIGECKAFVLRENLMRRFANRVRLSVLAKVPTENILAAAALLGISLEAV